MSGDLRLCRGASAALLAPGLPDGQKLPVCLVLGWNERGGYFKEPGTQPGTFRIAKRAPMTVTRRFERPE